MKHKICMIVHEYPPDPGASGFRMAYRARFLQSRGYEVDVFAPGAPAESQVESTGVRIHRIPAFMASTSADMDYRRFKKAGDTSATGVLHPLAGYLRWLPSLISKLRSFNGKDTILYSYNNPVSLHLAALAVRKRFSAWVCEFRDPIAGYEYSARGLLGKVSDGWLEKQILCHANVVCMRRGIQAEPADYATSKGKVVLLPDYGVNLDLFTDFERGKGDFEHPVGVFAGTVFSDISFESLSAGLNMYHRKHGDAEIRLFGPEHHEHFLYKNLSYGGNIEFKNLLDEYRSAHFLIIYDLSSDIKGINAGFFPSKLAELMAAQRSILFIGNLESITARLVSEMNIGVCVPNEPEAMAQAISEIMTSLKMKRFNLTMNEEKRKLIDAKAAEQEFVNMLSDI